MKNWGTWPPSPPQGRQNEVICTTLELILEGCIMHEFAPSNLSSIVSFFTKYAIFVPKFSSLSLSSSLQISKELEHFTQIDYW